MTSSSSTIDVEAVLQEGDEIEDAEGIDDASQQRAVFAQVFGPAGEKMLNEKSAYLGLDGARLRGCGAG